MIDGFDISGDLAIELLGESLVDEGPQAISRAFHAGARALLNQAVGDATRNPLWAPLAADLGVEVDRELNVHLGASTTAQAAARVNELEYGSPTTPPSPLLRRVVNHATPSIEKLMSKEMDFS